MLVRGAMTSSRHLRVRHRQTNISCWNAECSDTQGWSWPWGQVCVTAFLPLVLVDWPLSATLYCITTASLSLNITKRAQKHHMSSAGAKHQWLAHIQSAQLLLLERAALFLVFATCTVHVMELSTGLVEAEVRSVNRRSRVHCSIWAYPTDLRDNDSGLFFCYVLWSPELWPCILCPGGQWTMWWNQHV